MTMHLQKIKVGRLKFCFTLLFTLISLGAARGAESDLERLQAAFIQKIINYVEWPSVGSDQFVIAVFDNDHFLDVLKETLDEKVINGKTMKVVKADKNLKHAQIVCAHHNEKFKAISGDGILYITDDISGLQGKAILNFVLENGKLRFDINQSKALEHKIKINSRLLKLARQLK